MILVMCLCTQSINTNCCLKSLLVGECLAGALQWTDMVQLATEIGFAPPILVKSVVFTNDSDEIKRLLGNNFHR